MNHYIEFPHLGWKFPLNPTLVEFGSFSIKWYGVLIAIGFLLAVLYGMHRAKDFDLNTDKMMDTALLTTLVAFVGARLYYVLFSGRLSEYLANPLSILQVWNGGLGIYGGIIFAFVFGFLFCRLFKVSFLSMADIASLGFLIGQAVGRWGNFFNQEAFGGNTDLPWGMTGDIIAAGTKGDGYSTYLPVHPTFLYESLWCVLGFILLHILSKHLYKFKGQIFCCYLMWYGCGRFLIESVRTDSLMLGTMRVSQLVAVAAVLSGGILLLVLRRRQDCLPKDLLSAESITEPETAEETETETQEEEETNGNEN